VVDVHPVELAPLCHGASVPRTERAEPCEASGVSGPAGGSQPAPTERALRAPTSTRSPAVPTARAALLRRPARGPQPASWPAYSARLAELGSLRARYGCRLTHRDTVDAMRRRRTTRHENCDEEDPAEVPARRVIFKAVLD